MSIQASLQDFNQFETVLGENESERLQKLLYEDLCVTMSEELAEICESDFSNFYEKGIKGIVNKITYTYTSHEDIFRLENEDRSVYLQSDEHWALVSYYGITCQLSLSRMLEILQLNMKNLTSELQVGLLQYLYISGVLLELVLVVYFILNIRYLTNDIQAIEFLLTFLPYEKLNEATTCQMLKAIRQY